MKWFAILMLLGLMTGCGSKQELANPAANGNTPSRDTAMPDATDDSPRATGDASVDIDENAPQAKTPEEAMAIYEKLDALTFSIPSGNSGSVETLMLMGKSLRDGHLKHLKALPHLKKLSVRATSITENGFEHFAGLTELRDLSVGPIGESGVTSAGTKYLAELQHLEELTISLSGVEDSALQRLGEIKSLKVLNLGHNRITDAGLEHLKGLSNLEKLNLKSSYGVTDEGVKALQAALPNCKIER